MNVQAYFDRDDSPEEICPICDGDGFIKVGELWTASPPPRLAHVYELCPLCPGLNASNVVKKINVVVDSDGIEPPTLAPSTRRSTD